MMRILVHDHAGHPFQVQLSRELARRGHEVMHSWCARLQTPRGAMQRRDDDADSLQLSPLDLGRDFEKYGLISRWRQEGEYGRRLAQRVEEFEPDIVISGNTPLRTQAMFLSSTRRNGAAFVFWVQDVLGVGIRQALRRRLGPVGRLPAEVLSRLERRLWKKSSHVVVISEDFLPGLPGAVGRERTTVIHNWAPLEEMPVRSRENAWSNKLTSGHGPRFVYTGTLGLKHNPELLADLARRIGVELGGEVLVVSEGPGADYLEGLGIENLTVMPFQPFERMPEVLACADVLVALLESDAGEFAVPSKVLTYLCAARPLLLAVPRRNLARRIVENAGAGLAVNPEDRKEFIEAALRVGRDEGMRSQMAEQARDYAERTFDINAITDRFETVFQTARNEKRN